MKAVRIAAVVVLMFVLQVAFVSKTRVLGVHVDLLFVFALAAAITGGRNRGVWAGFVAGMIADAFMVSPLGLSAFAYAVACYGVGAFAEETSGAPWVIALVAAVGAFSGWAVYMLFGSAIGDVHSSVGHALTVIMVETFSAALIAPVAAWALRNAWQKRAEAW